MTNILRVISFIKTCFAGPEKNRHQNIRETKTTKHFNNFNTFDTV